MHCGYSCGMPWGDDHLYMRIYNLSQCHKSVYFTSRTIGLIAAPMNYKAIAEALEKKLGGQTRAAKAVGVSQPAFRAWLKGGQISGENMISLREAAVEHGIVEVDHVRLIGGVAKSATLRELDARAGAGGGGVSTIEPKRRGVDFHEDAFRDEEWGMPLSFLRSELKMNPQKAIVAEIQGDSGYNPSDPAAPGSLFPGDRVIIDTDDRRPSPPGPFAVFDGFGVVVKLVELLPETEPPRMRLSSRNPTYLAYEITSDEAVVIGRVKGRISRL